MAELKFRAWDKHYKEMDYIHDLYWFEEQGVRDYKGNGHCTSYVIMQYANLHDMTGKELYDGDISVDKRNRKWITWLDKGGFRICTVKEYVSTGGNPLFIEELSHMKNVRWFESTHKIIGNIYENPDIFEKTYEVI